MQHEGGRGCVALAHNNRITVIPVYEDVRSLSGF